MNIDLTPGPDLAPLYPTPAQLTELLESHQQLTAQERQSLIAHCLHKAVVFGDITLLTFLLHNSVSRNYVDLSVVDEDGLGLVSQAILGFGEESEQDIEREETVRMLIAEGADLITGDAVGWSPLHHAALHAPPTLVSHLLNHGVSSLTTTHKGLTALDIITAYEELPGRQEVAALLEAAMRGCGWGGSERERMRERRKNLKEAHQRKTSTRTREWSAIGKVLDIEDGWWGEIDAESDGEDIQSESGDEDSDEEEPIPYTPPRKFDSMLVFSLADLPDILDSLIAKARPVLYPLSRRAAPANGLYLLARYACIWCDATWLEDLLIGTVDKIEEAVYARPDHLPHVIFWLYNTTLLLHLLRCDLDVTEMCDALELFDLLEELINAIYVFVIRVAEKRIDTLIDPALLEYSPLSSEFDQIQFESDNWSFFRSLAAPRKKGVSTPTRKQPTTPNGGTPNNSSSLSLNMPAHSPTPTPPPGPKDSPSLKAFGSLRNTFSRSSPSPALSSIFRDQATSPNVISPTSITNVLTALHTLLSLYSINPTLIIQANSQILYWTSCELFNRLLTRKRYLCRSRAMQIGMNVSAIEEWVGQVGLPKGAARHFSSVKELLSWLQCLSAIQDFPALIDTIQTMKNLNPLQMRRAVRDYRYEVGEGRMTEECNQYLAQLQKDWERRRVKLGVELARKEREIERGDSSNSDEALYGDKPITETHRNREREANQLGIDLLFDRDRPKSDWIAPRPPEALGELMDSRFMIPVVLPSDPTLICTTSGPEALHPPSVITAGMDSFFPFDPQPTTGTNTNPTSIPIKVSNGSRASSRASHRSHASISSIGSVTRGPMRWRKGGRRVRIVSADLLDWVDAGSEPKSRQAIYELYGAKRIAGAWSDLAEFEVDDHEDQADDIDGEENQDTPSARRVHHHVEFSEPEHRRDITITPNDLTFDAQSPSSNPSPQSYLTPGKPSLADRRRSLRLARRSSGGETAMPEYDPSWGITPTVDNPTGSFA